MIGTVVLPILVVVTLVFVNGAFVAAEFALVGARYGRLQTMAVAGSRSARWLVAVFDRAAGKDGYIAIAQLGITLASIGLGMYGEPAVAHWLYGPFESWGMSAGTSHTVGFVIALSGITYLHVVFGEMIPKALALQSPERISVRVNPLMRVFAVVFRPMVKVLNVSALGLMRALRISEPDEQHALYTSAELAIVTDEAAVSGELGGLQRDLIRNIFDLDACTAAELMTPRDLVEVIDVDATQIEIAHLIGASSRSRYPVVRGDLDQVIGVVHIKDFIRARQHGGPVDAARLARPLPTVSASATGEHLLGRFKQERVHACLVVDESGAAIGFVTLDDVIAEIMTETEITDA